MKTYTTAELQKKLDVSRSWINNHLRVIGIKVSRKPNLKNQKGVPVYYTEEDVVNFINSNLHASKQIEYVYMSDLLEEKEFKKFMKEIKNVTTVSDAKKLIICYIGEDLYELIGVQPRNRGKFKWNDINNFELNNLNELQSFKKIKENFREGTADEIVYRYLFLKRYIRIEVFGRVWWVKNQEKDRENDFELYCSFEAKEEILKKRSKWN